MLIQALCEYFDMLAAAGKVTPEGYSKVKIHYLVHLTQDGKIDTISSYQKIEKVPVGKDKIKEKAVPREELMPERTEKPGIEANVVEHRPLYLFGLNYADDALSPADKTDKAKKSHMELVKSNLEFIKDIDSPVVNAYRCFLENWVPEQEIHNKCLLALGKDYSKSNYIFCLKGRPDLLLHQDAALKEKWEKTDKAEEGEKPWIAQCSITGETTEIERVHKKIKGIAGGAATGSVLIGFNNASESSYGTEQAYNSNISKTAMKKYTEALNYLLSSQRHKALIDDMTVVFWAMNASENSEDILNAMLFGEKQGTGGVSAEQTNLLLRQVLENAGNAAVTDKTLLSFENIDPNVDFYMVGLKPNSSRVAVKFIYRKKYGEILGNIAKFQRDMQVTEHGERVYMYKIKKELVSPKSSDKKVDSAMMAKLFESILYNTDCPYTLLDTIVRRIRTDLYIGEVRAGILKTCINRNNKNKEEQITMALNEESTNQAYLCGRLFAVLEALQQDALGKLNRTIKDTYFSSASMTPELIFPKLIRLSQNHLKKAKHPVFYNKQIGEITDKLQEEFPKRLSLQEQGRFEIGYYQQWQSYYKKSTDKVEEEK